MNIGPTDQSGPAGTHGRRVAPSGFAKRNGGCKFTGRGLPLFRAQSPHGIKARGVPGRGETGGNSHDQRQCSHDAKYDGIEGCGLVEHAANQAHYGRAREQADQESSEGWFKPVPQQVT